MAISIHDRGQIEAHVARCGVGQAGLRTLRNAFYKKSDDRHAALATLPTARRQAVAESLRFHELQLRRVEPSRLDGARKLLFATESGLVLETVILQPATGRTALCLSSQVGCAAACAFCATGHMRLARNLSAAEILDQLIQANQLLRPDGRRVRNVVFMGMGEPLHNEDNLHDTLEVLLAPSCFDYTPRHVMVSTVGLPEAMVRLARRFPGIGVALSLHSGCQETRERIVPLARRYTLDALREAVIELNGIQPRGVMIEYLMLDALNDTPRELRALISFLRGLSARVNLIPYNPIAEAPELRGSGPERRRAFGVALRQAGFAVTTRHSLGADIQAACGQLARRQRGMKGGGPRNGPPRDRSTRC